MSVCVCIQRKAPADMVLERVVIPVMMGRKLEVPKAHKGVAFFHFGIRLLFQSACVVCCGCCCSVSTAILTATQRRSVPQALGCCRLHRRDEEVSHRHSRWDPTGMGPHFPDSLLSHLTTYTRTHPHMVLVYNEGQERVPTLHHAD